MSNIKLDQTVENFKQALNNSIKAEQMKSDWRTMAKQSTMDSKKAIWLKGTVKCLN